MHRKSTLIHILSAAICLLFASSASAQNPLQDALKWTDLGNGVQTASASLKLFDSDQCISVVRYKASRHVTEIVNDPCEFSDTTSAMALRHGAQGAINGSFFMAGPRPNTFVKDDGVQEGRTPAFILYSVDGLVTVRNGHKVSIFPCDTSSYAAATKHCQEALATGPVLVRDGRPAQDTWIEMFYERHPRSIIGTTRNGWVYYVVVDGRSRGNAAGASIPEAAEISLMLGLHDSINLDGGGSSTLWEKSQGVISHPSDNRKFDHYGQRKVPNIIIFK